MALSPRVNRLCRLKWFKDERADTIVSSFWTYRTHTWDLWTGKLSTWLKRGGPIAYFPWKFISPVALVGVCARPRVMWIAFTLREWDLVPNCGLMGTDWDVFAFVVDFSRVCGFPWPGLRNSDRSVRFSRLMRLLDRCTALSKKWKWCEEWKSMFVLKCLYHMNA